MANGLRAPESKEEKGLLYGKTLENFGSLTTPELEIAADMNSTGELGKRTEHYGQFSFDWLAQVLTKYQEHRRKALQKFRRNLPPPREHQVTDEDLWIGLKNRWIKGAVPVLYGWGRVCRHLRQQGKINQDDLDKATAKIRSQISKDSTKRDPEKIRIRATNQAEKEAVLDYLTRNHTRKPGK